MGLRVGIERSGSVTHKPIRLASDQPGRKARWGNKPCGPNTPQLV